MSKLYDIIVVGAGPAGLMAAKTAAENGLNVALLERKTSLTNIYRVDAGAIGVNETLFGQLVTFNQRDRRLCFPHSGFSLPYDGPFTNIYGFQIYSPGGKRLVFGDWDEARRTADASRVGIVLSKELLLSRILEDARACHVDIFPGTNVCGIQSGDAFVEVESSRGTYRGVFVIAADGVNSRIARITGLNMERKFQGTMKYIGCEIRGRLPVDPGSFNFVLTEEGTFAVVPTYREDVYHVGIFSFNTRFNLKAAFKKFIAGDSPYADWFAHAELIGQQACVVNEFSPVSVPFRDNILFIGDTVWSREFSNMAALCSGWKAGYAVALALAERKPNREGIAPYLEWWHDYFYGPYGTIEFVTADLQDFLSGEHIDYLVSLIESPLPATMNFYTLFNLIGHTYGELFPRIQDERPDIMEKMMEMRSRLDDIAEEHRKIGFPNR